MAQEAFTEGLPEYVEPKSEEKRVVIASAGETTLVPVSDISKTGTLHLGTAGGRVSLEIDLPELSKAGEIVNNTLTIEELLYLGRAARAIFTYADRLKVGVERSRTGYELTGPKRQIYWCKPHLTVEFDSSKISWTKIIDDEEAFFNLVKGVIPSLQAKEDMKITTMGHPSMAAIYGG